MKNFISAAAIIAALASGSAYASPATASGNTSTVAGSATAKVIAPIKLTHVSGAVLNFGTFTAGSGGTVVVTAAGSGSTTGDVGFAPLSTNAADSFTVAGDPSRSFSIATQSGTVTAATSSATMAFTTSASANSATLDNAGAASFTVGGTLTVASAQAPDAYAGTYNATVTYN